MSNSINLTEEQEHVALADWLRFKKIRFTTSANGGLRHPSVANKLHKMGVSPGFPDIEIPIPRGKFHGCYVELKRKKKGIVSAYQKDWLEFLSNNGYFATLAYGFDEAKELIEFYLSLETSND